MFYNLFLVLEAHDSNIIAKIVAFHIFTVYPWYDHHLPVLTLDHPGYELSLCEKVN